MMMTSIEKSVNETPSKDVRRSRQKLDDRKQHSYRPQASGFGLDLVVAVHDDRLHGD
jgi:hypothetical protein